MACLLHSQAIPVTVMIMSELISNVFKKHKEICGDFMGELAMEKGEAHESSEKTASLSEKAKENDEEASPPPRVDLSQCLDRHPLSKLYPFAILLPVATAAMINAGLLFYTRYLDSPDSQAWFSRFAFGWITIALLCACMLILSHWNDYMIHESCVRPNLAFIAPFGELKYRIVALSLMTLVRCIVRSLLSQDPLAWFSYSSDTGITLIGTLGMTHSFGSDDTPKHLLDRVLDIIPPWVGTTTSIISAVYVWGYIFYSRWQERRQRRQTAE